METKKLWRKPFRDSNLIEVQSWTVFADLHNQSTKLDTKDEGNLTQHS